MKGEEGGLGKSRQEERSPFGCSRGGGRLVAAEGEAVWLQQSREMMVERKRERSSGKEGSSPPAVKSGRWTGGSDVGMKCMSAPVEGE